MQICDRRPERSDLGLHITDIQESHAAGLPEDKKFESSEDIFQVGEHSVIAVLKGNQIEYQKIWHLTTCQQGKKSSKIIAVFFIYRQRLCFAPNGPTMGAQ